MLGYFCASVSARGGSSLPFNCDLLSLPSVFFLPFEDMSDHARLPGDVMLLVISRCSVRASVYRVSYRTDDARCGPLSSVTPSLTLI